MNAQLSFLRWTLALIGVLACCGARADAAAERSDQLKAAYLFNFVQFVEWPLDGSVDPLHICFAGAPGVRASLESAVNGKRVGERPLVVRSLDRGESPTSCSVVYFEQPDTALLEIARASALTVAYADGFTHQGGVIQLFTQSNRLRFIINVENAKRARLRISSNLLKLASTVEQEPYP